MGVTAGKQSQDFTCLLGMPRGLKGLLHTLNAIVSPLCLLLLFCFSFCFAKGLAKCKFGVFDERQILHIWTL